MTVERPVLRAKMGWLIGPAVWAAHFFLLYGLASFACGRSEAIRPDVIRLTSLGLTVVAVAILAGFLSWRSGGVRRRANSAATEDVTVFLRATAKVLAIWAIIAIVWTALSVLTIPPCVDATSTSPS